MRHLLLLLFLVSGSYLIKAQDFIAGDNGSKVHFTIKNFGISTGGDFKGVKGSVFFNPAFPSSAKFDVSVSAATVDTDNESRDKDLKEALYFNVAAFPEIRIVSTRIDKTNKTDDGFYFFTGNLVIKGITKEISFPFKAEKTLNDYLFTGDFEINRLDFEVGEKSAVLSQKVVVNLKILAKKK